MTPKQLLFAWRDGIRNDNRISRSLYPVLLELSMYADTETGRCWPGHATLARALRCSEKTIGRQLSAGVDLGWLGVDQRASGGRNGKGRATVYRLTIPAQKQGNTGHGCPSFVEEEQETVDVREQTPDICEETPDTRCPANSQSQLSSTTLSEKLSKNGSTRSTSVDALQRRCIDIFAAKGVDRDDCVRAVDRLRGDDIADELIEMALTHCEQKADVRFVGYLLKVARDWKTQRTPTP
jgi:hypothetical protein